MFVFRSQIEASKYAPLKRFTFLICDHNEVTQMPKKIDVEYVNHLRFVLFFKNLITSVR